MTYGCSKSFDSYMQNGFMGCMVNRPVDTKNNATKLLMLLKFLLLRTPIKKLKLRALK